MCVDVISTWIARISFFFSFFSFLPLMTTMRLKCLLSPECALCYLLSFLICITNQHNTAGSIWSCKLSALVSFQSTVFGFFSVDWFLNFFTNYFCQKSKIKFDDEHNLLLFCVNILSISCSTIRGIYCSSLNIQSHAKQSTWVSLSFQKEIKFTDGQSRKSTGRTINIINSNNHNTMLLLVMLFQSGETNWKD